MNAITKTRHKDSRLAKVGTFVARRAGSSMTSSVSFSMLSAFVGGLGGHRPDIWGPLLPVMSLRAGGVDITPEAQLRLLQERGGTARPLNVAIYVHGLLIDEQNWTRGADPLPQRIERTLGWHPMLVRYNTGRHISENGNDLARLLIRLRESWGERLGRVQLFGHSMGGLVCRSALRALERHDADVLNHIERLFLLATPNHGADLERMTHATEYALNSLGRLPSTLLRAVGVGDGRTDIDGSSLLAVATAMPMVPLRGLSSLFASRSDGIRDISFGYMQKEEWESAQHDEHRFLLNHRRPLPPPSGVRVYAIAGSLWPDVGAEPSRLRNDGLVSVASAAGRDQDFDDLRVVENGRFAEVPLLVHQLVPASARVLTRIRHWVDHDI